MQRRRLKKSASKRAFRRGARVKKRNIKRKSHRGGIRL